VINLAEGVRVLEMDAVHASIDDSHRKESPERVVHAGALFGDRREIVIEHDGERYRLRITRRGKLILQK
jgi:hemin uptake protein HemP